MKKLMACLLVVATSGCPDVKVDSDEVAGGPTVEFDPARSQETGARFIPFPNDLARDATTGKINLGPQNCESATSKATRENVLNQLDGFGTYETAMQVTFTQDVDEASLADHILMYQLTSEGTAIEPSASTQPVPVKVVRVAKTPRFATADCNTPEMVAAVTFVPLVPLEQKSTYFVALTKGIKSTSGEAFAPAYTWAIVASSDQPVTLDDQGNIVSDRTPLDPASDEERAQLIALAGLWQLHQPGLKFVQAASGTSPEDVLVGFQFTTQTVTDPLDPTVDGSPAKGLGAGGVLQASSVTNKFGQLGTLLCGAEATTDPAVCFLKLALGGCSPLTTGCGANNYQAGTAACQLLNCAAVGDVIGGGIVTTNYQTQIPNDKLEGGAALQGAWSDPLDPEPQGQLVLETLVIQPKGTAPAGGWPTVVFGHAISSSKESALAIGGRLAQYGFATVAIDTAAHGSRAVRISKDINLGCMGRCFSGTTPTQTECETIADCQAGETCGSATATPGFLPPSPTTAPQCYGSFLSPDLAVTRDGVRQTILDQQRVVKALKTCGPSGCAPISVDPSRIFYLGMSLGAFIGTASAATAPDLKAVVLDTGGVGWADFLENTETLAIRCQLVNGLIDAGILQGDKWTGGADGLCTTDAWKEQPGYATFAAIGRWVLDPADPANFARRLATKPLLIQKVGGDEVIPNVTTDNQAAVAGLAMEQAADPFDPAAPAPSAAISTNPTESKFIAYTDDDDDAYVHSSLLRPAPTTDPQVGINGTLRLQIDAATFLFNNK